jgi:hypothetical protein
MDLFSPLSGSGLSVGGVVGAVQSGVFSKAATLCKILLQAAATYLDEARVQ